MATGSRRPLTDINPSDYDLSSITWEKVFRNSDIENDDLLKMALRYDPDSFNLHRMISGYGGAENLVKLFLPDPFFPKIKVAALELVESTDTKRAKMEQHLPTPSDYAKQNEYDKNVCDHRPSHGLHVSLQMKLFGQFVDEMNDSCVEDKYCSVASKLMVRMSDYFYSEQDRVNAFFTKVRPLGWNITSFNKNCGKSDGAICMDGITTTAMINFEFKKEFSGCSSCPVKQNIACFMNFKEGEGNIRSPMLLVSIVGVHYLQVFGAVWNGSTPCVDPLTSPISLLCVRRDPLYAIRNVAKVLQAIDYAIPRLEEYYKNTDKSAEFGSKGPYYGIKEYHYKSKNQFNLDWLFQASAKNDADTKRYVIKFVRSHYGIEPHELLANHGYAPKVFKCDKLDGGWIAIVMEFVKGGMLYQKDKEDPGIMSSLKEAVSLMQENNYVHGDLRNQNILVRKGGAGICILDFDWAGRNGEAKYPMELNKENYWHSGVECGGLIHPEHDNYQVA